MNDLGFLKARSLASVQCEKTMRFLKMVLKRDTKI